jgi:hypothetical protein
MLTRRFNATSAVCVLVVALSVAVNAYELKKREPRVAVLATAALHMVASSHRPTARTADQVAVVIAAVEPEPVQVTELPPVQTYELQPEFITGPQLAPAPPVAKPEPQFQFEAKTVHPYKKFADALAELYPNEKSFALSAAYAAEPKAEESFAQKQEEKPKLHMASLPPAKATPLPPVYLNAPATRIIPGFGRKKRIAPSRMPPYAEWGPTADARYEFAKWYVFQICPDRAQKEKETPALIAEGKRLLTNPFATEWLVKLNIRAWCATGVITAALTSG